MTRRGANVSLWQLLSAVLVFACWCCRPSLTAAMIQLCLSQLSQQVARRRHGAAAHGQPQALAAQRGLLSAGVQDRVRSRPLS